MYIHNYTYIITSHPNYLEFLKELPKDSPSSGFPIGKRKITKSIFNIFNLNPRLSPSYTDVLLNLLTGAINQSQMGMGQN